jgi:hypothetical protein
MPFEQFFRRADMPRKEYDPFDRIPSAEAVRERLSQTLALARKLKILLRLAEQLRPPITADRPATEDRTAPEPLPRYPEVTSR